MQNALRDTEPSQAACISRRNMQGQQQGFIFVGHERSVCERAGCDHPDHLALHRSFAGGHIAYLLANRHRLTQLDEFGQIIFNRMKRHARHGNGLASCLTAVGQGDVHQASGTLGIFKEHFIKVTHAVENQGVRKIRLDAQVLLHHGRVGTQVERVCHGLNWAVR